VVEPSSPSSPDRFVSVAADDPRALPVLKALEREYDTRYGAVWGDAGATEINRYPIEAFSPPHGAFVLLMRDDEMIAGGAFKAFDAGIVEFKRIWASPEHRRQGLARRIVTELEDEARRRGVEAVYLTTGPRQPEAVRLYLATGYTPLFDPEKTPEQIVIYGFAKSLTGEPLDLARMQRLHEADVGDFVAQNPFDGGLLDQTLAADAGAARGAQPTATSEAASAS
jgi:GNAT superfamily N-acetyltransferase